MQNKPYKFNACWGIVTIEAPTKEIANTIIKKLMIIPITELEKIGFEAVCPREFEDTFSYDLHNIAVNESYISVATEYDLKGVVRHQYVDVNDRTLKGDPIGIEELKILIRLL